MDIHFTSGRRAGRLGHVLPEDLDRLRAAHQHRSEVADQGGHDVPGFERVRAGDALALLAERAVKPANDLPLPVQIHQPFLEGARQQEVIVDIEQLIAAQVMGNRFGGHLSPSPRRSASTVEPLRCRDPRTNGSRRHEFQVSRAIEAVRTPPGGQ